MTLHGYVNKGTITVDEPIPLGDGVEVTIELHVLPDRTKVSAPRFPVEEIQALWKEYGMKPSPGDSVVEAREEDRDLGCI